MRRRRTADPPADSPFGVLLACEREAEAGGDAQRLVQVRSWIHMLRLAGDDPVIGELFTAFAREGG